MKKLQILTAMSLCLNINFIHAMDASSTTDIDAQNRKIIRKSAGEIIKMEKKGLRNSAITIMLQQPTNTAQIQDCLREIENTDKPGYPAFFAKRSLQFAPVQGQKFGILSITYKS